MVDLNMDECDHLMGIWKICAECETTILEDSYGGISGCNCLYHYFGCPVPRVPENHSCSLEFKQQMITNYVKKIFSTDDVRGAYKRYKEDNYLSLINEKTASNITKEDCNLLMTCWRICFWCETKMEEKNNQSNTPDGWIYDCKCLSHDYCPVPRVRKDHHPSDCSLQLKTEVVTNYVRKTYQTDNVRAAFKKYMEQNLPALVGQEKPDEKTVRIEELEVRYTRNQKALTEARRLCGKLRKKLENEKQSNVEKLRSIRNKLSDTTAKLTRSEEKQKKSDLKCKEVRAACDNLNQQNARLQEENVFLNQKEEEKKQQMAQILADLEGETAHFKQKWTELQEKSNKLEQLNEKLHDDIQSSKVESELKREQFEIEKKEMVSEKNEIQEQLNRISGKHAKINHELREMKRKWMEVRATDGFESKEKVFDESNDTAPDECILKFEMDSFQLLFDETQMKISELGKKSFSTRNNRLRKELNQKISPATEISCEVEDEVVNVLKKKERNYRLFWKICYP